MSRRYVEMMTFTAWDCGPEPSTTFCSRRVGSDLPHKCEEGHPWAENLLGDTWTEPSLPGRWAFPCPLSRCGLARAVGFCVVLAPDSSKFVVAGRASCWIVLFIREWGKHAAISAGVYALDYLLVEWSWLTPVSQEWSHRSRIYKRILVFRDRY